MRPAVALPLHRLDHHRADRGGIGIGRARDAGEENHRDQNHVAQPAADVPYQHARETDQPLRNASRLHQLAGENEERDRQQRKVVDAAEDAAGDDP
jgi:hypothetical protein